MKARKIKALFLSKSLSLAALIIFSGSSFAESLSPLVDDFSDAKNNSFNIARQFMNDTVAGGGTTTEQSVAKGIISLRGEIVPPRGQPGWASTVLLFNQKNLPVDASSYEGIRLLVKINSGNISISANSTEVTNFDYHAALVVAASDDKFHEIKIPFSSMKRTWSEQTQLNNRTISGLSIVAFDMQKSSFDFEVDEVSFY